MAKEKILWYCKECGNEYSKWQGQCSGCKEWNTIVEAPKRIVSKGNPNKSSIITETNVAKKLKEVTSDNATRIDTGLKELNRVLGGGLVLGSVVLLGGDPGIGKSTILLQICDTLANNGKVLYVTGEESSAQVKLRAERLNTKNDDIYLISETDLDVIENNINEIKPDVIIVDSVQTLYRNSIESSAGSVSQVKGVAESFTYIAKQTNCTVILVGHVTKEGTLAGPRILEHLVDTVLYFEGDRYEQFRILRTVKNRFGSTNEIGIFEMKENGFSEVENPSLLFINEDNNSAGCAITCTMEGTRPILVEIQALTTASSFANPRRTATGFDYNKSIVIAAIIEKRAKIDLQKHDIYMNVVGGFKLQDRSSDLTIALSIVSSILDKPVKKGFASIGELTLTGDIRSVGNIESRIKECERLRFSDVIIPLSSKKLLSDFKTCINIHYVKDINDAIQIAIKDKK